MQHALRAPVLTALLAASSLAHAGTPVAEDSLISKADAPVALRFSAEVGTLATLRHQLQFGADGDEVSVPRDLGQNVLYPFLRFQADLDDASVKGQVERDTKQANALQVGGTPGFFINGRFLSGAQPFPAFKQIIDEELARN